MTPRKAAKPREVKTVRAWAVVSVEGFVFSVYPYRKQALESSDLHYGDGDRIVPLTGTVTLRALEKATRTRRPR